MRARRVDFIACAVLLLAGCGGQDAGRIDTACRSNADCAPTELCATGLCENGVGVCQERPVVCDESVVDEVCGCDGQTYQNDCFASLNGIRLARTGPCGVQ